MTIAEKEKKYVDIIEGHMAKGVEFFTSHGILIDETVTIGAGTKILPGTILKGNTKIGENCVIGPNSLLENCTVESGAVINACQCYQSVIMEGAKIGPFTQIRPDCVIGKGAKIGDFVEVKNSNIGEGTAIAHLTYIGDSDVGRHVNFGCGVVTVNYDGENKNRTTIGDYAFIGCNSNLIAPVKIGMGAYTAAGSTITKDVGDTDLAVARARQENKIGWAKQKLAKYIEKHSR
ncbi:MAG: DapH/DapD/GlmU-related protein [Oscillospiraceae bacterium]